MGLDSSRRYVLTKDSGWEIVQRPYAQLEEMKPYGLWYAVGDEWVEWLRSEMGGATGHVYEIEVDISRLVVIDTTAKLLAFDRQYHSKQRYSTRLQPSVC